MDNEHLIEELRPKVVRMFNEAFPGADRNEAWRWRMKNVGVADTEHWTLTDWQRAHEALRVKLGIKVRKPLQDQSLALPL